MKKNLAKKITMSILAGAMLMSSSVVWAGSDIVNSASGSGAIAIGGGAGASPTANGSNAVAIGLQAKANGAASVAIGDGAIADAVNVVSVGNGGASGAGGPDYRKIINVKDGTDEHDAVTLGQLQNNYYDINQIDEKFRTLGGASSGTGSVDLSDYAKTDDVANTYATKAETQTALDGKANKATTLEGYGIIDAYTKTEIDGMMLGGSSDAIAGINQRLYNTNAKINKVGAGAAALAALHPLEYDPDDKLTFSAGMGNYAGENAAALGAFYRPNEKFMISLGGTMGNGENMVNLGLSIGLDKPNGFAKLSKRELIQKVNVMEAKYEAVEAENEAMKDQLANADERIAKLEALVAQLVAK